MLKSFLIGLTLLLWAPVATAGPISAAPLKLLSPGAGAPTDAPLCWNPVTKAVNQGGGCRAATNFVFSTSGPLLAAERLPGFSWPTAITLDSALSTGAAAVAATLDTQIDVYDWGTLVAIVDYRPGILTPQIVLVAPAMASPVFLYAQAPDTPDATLSGVAFTLGGR